MQEKFNLDQIQNTSCPSSQKEGETKLQQSFVLHFCRKEAEKKESWHEDIESQNGFGLQFDVTLKTLAATPNMSKYNNIF